MSIAGAVMIVVIILIRALAINRLPKATFIILWMVALARLLVQFSVPSVFSIYSLFDSTTTNVTAQYSAENIESIAVATGTAPEAVQQIQHQIIPSAIENSTFGLTFVWMIGAVITLVCFGTAYVVCFRKLSKAKDVSHPAINQWMNRHSGGKSISVRSSADITSPLTYGIFRPVIVLPDNMDPDNAEQLEYVLSHELTHILRFDLLKKLAVILAVCLHWFNPLVWVMFIIFNRDIELACDETVIFRTGHSSRKAYAMALIDMEEKRSLPGTLYTCFNRNAIEERIVAIMKIKRPTLVRLVVSAAIVVAVCLGFATTAYANQDEHADTTTPVSSADSRVIVSTTDTVITEYYADESIVVIEVATDILPETMFDGVSGNNWVWPVSGDRITREFGPSENPLRGSSDHITIACDRGDTVVSAISGKVTEAAFTPEYGNYVVICGDNNVRTMYAHLDDISVSVGQTVASGDNIGAAGATGMVTGPCLSFYAFVNDQAVDPVSFYE